MQKPVIVRLDAGNDRGNENKKDISPDAQNEREGEVHCGNEWEAALNV